MARVQIIKDDYTGAEIETEADVQSVKIAVEFGGKTYSGEWETSAFTAESLRALAADADLASFVLRMKGFVKAGTADTEIMRKFVTEYAKAHPDEKITVPARGRFPAELAALYRREMAKSTQSPATGTTDDKPEDKPDDKPDNNSGGRAS